MISMTGQQVVVIGGTSGIGLAIARQSEAAGAHVTIASRRQANIDAALDLFKDATGHVVDVLDPGSVTALFDQVGPFAHLVYTAGGPLSMMMIADLDLDQARSFFEARYFGALNAVHMGIPHLAPGGSITLTSGTAAEHPGSGWALGASVCGAMNSLTRSLAVELAPIRVNAVAPGVTRSAVWSQMSDADREGMYEQLGDALPLGRVGEPADAADAYLYCMTQPYTTGQVVTVDGGSVLV
jgi:NAD(P)-dependent dehydrogenase (short-subunit alcohol dehydrogenase family)